MSLKLININLNQFDFIEDFKNLKELAIENVNGFEMEKIDKPLSMCAYNAAYLFSQ